MFTDQSLVPQQNMYMEFVLSYSLVERLIRSTVRLFNDAFSPTQIRQRRKSVHPHCGYELGGKKEETAVSYSIVKLQNLLGQADKDNYNIQAEYLVSESNSMILRPKIS